MQLRFAEVRETPRDFVDNLRTTLGQLAGPGVEPARDVFVVRADTLEGYLTATAEVHVGTSQVSELELMVGVRSIGHRSRAPIY